MNTRVIQPRMKLAGTACLLLATIASWSTASELVFLDTGAQPLIQPVNWQVPAEEPIVDPLIEPVPPVPPGPDEPPTTPPMTPLLDGSNMDEQVTPPLTTVEPEPLRRGVRPYGGGHPGDWPWGCGGSPYRTGPGVCDNWDVGCRWDVGVDGIVMMRQDADLAAIEARMRAIDDTGTVDDVGMMNLVPVTEQFDYAPGGRVSLISKFPHYTWQMHAGYEGIEEWNSSIVFEKLPLEVFALPPPGSPDPPLPIDLATEQRRLYYRSSLHSGELNFVRDDCSPVWRPYCGVRYVKFDDEINDFVDQQAPPPLPGAFGVGDPDAMPPVPPPTGPLVTTTDRLNLFDVENNLIGFQIGMRHDLWRPMRRLSIEGFVNAGVYYNSVKYTNLMGTITRQDIADNLDTAEVETGTSRSETFNNDVREYSEISYIAEASLSGVCRLNKCWALRAGYQALWITDVHLAEDAFLFGETFGRDMFFHGWHAGVEHRR